MTRSPTRGTPASRGDPLQKRSRETQEGILRSTEQLMSRLGSSEFTLADVSRESGVSVGGIYRRFAGKDALVAAVQQRVYRQLDIEALQIEAGVARQADSLETRASLLVAGTANMLKRHAPMIKAIVEASWSNVIVAREGVRVYRAHAQRFKAQLLRYRRSIRHENPEHAVDFCFSCVYELVASYFGFGRRVATDESRWAQLVLDLQRLCLAFLTSRSAAPLPGRRRLPHRLSR
jgi:AcrR family transcriptional regulator